ncbi:hypothetical protein BS47DRAFT_1396395 [Hydnum rufescens UP504]|uniref:Uncharacterized protein n=1 Tax=Hydnum rufescens UP504 TaxID=1448309 RepID=A0A9P6AQ87_9AGAM|nr:hypothetical protein BS47DRAFT_1396395 [Hydnum rufescens UP504]
MPAIAHAAQTFTRTRGATYEHLDVKYRMFASGELSQSDTALSPATLKAPALLPEMTPTHKIQKRAPDATPAPREGSSAGERGSVPIGHVESEQQNEPIKAGFQVGPIHNERKEEIDEKDVDGHVISFDSVHAKVVSSVGCNTIQAAFHPSFSLPGGLKRPWSLPERYGLPAVGTLLRLSLARGEPPARTRTPRHTTIPELDGILLDQFLKTQHDGAVRPLRALVPPTAPLGARQVPTVATVPHRALVACSSELPPTPAFSHC